MPAIPLTHVFTHFLKLGGVESLLKRHLEGDQRCGGSRAARPGGRLFVEDVAGLGPAAVCDASLAGP